MNEKYLISIKGRIEKALKNNMPYESKLIFVGELSAACLSDIISINEEDELLNKLGFNRMELYKWTDFVGYGKIQDED